MKVKEFVDTATCPALVIAAPSSGHGKTSITAGIARYHSRLGRKVTIFKIGPDFLDPMIHKKASGSNVYNIDLWMVGEKDVKTLLYNAAKKSDLILLEGVMGAFDGMTSCADVARLFNIPMVFVINASSMAATFGAIAHGLRTYEKGLNILGVIGNRVASISHEGMIKESINQEESYLGTFYRSEKYALPSRHLGLVQASEIDELDTKLNFLADAVGDTSLNVLPQDVAFYLPEPVIKLNYLLNKKIAIAKDEAFTFIYQANIDLLKNLGADVIYFSPIHDYSIPEADVVWFPGGYPELHLDNLANNVSMINAIRDFFHSGKHIYSECGGMLYLLDSLVDHSGYERRMVGLLQGQGVMQKKLASVGMQWIELAGGKIHGHTFHHSSMKTSFEPLTYAIDLRSNKIGEPVYRIKGLTASYFHSYFPSDPLATARLFGYLN